MDTNLVIVIILLGLAIMDLMVGVANDAVNFLNSAIGSKVAKFRTILIVASLGILVGVMMSGGMMEIARKGIFNPEYFFMPELLVIFIAVMFQDILLLDTFNTFGLPTSTTVSVIFGLFGSALAVSVIKVTNAGQDISLVFNYIQSGTVLKIIGGIILSIFIAFIVSSIIQYFTRMIFTFDYKHNFKKYGPIWAGFSLSFLSYFLIIKGLKGSDLIPKDFKEFIIGDFFTFFGILVLFWTIITYILTLFKSFNPLKFIVLFGTFALALAFAANDLVNFIGAPVAGLNAYQLSQGMENPLTTGMSVMAEKVQVENYLLFIAGLIMVVTLFFNKKAYTVSKTTISLTRQSDGYERFESNLVARLIVRLTINLFNFIKSITPDSLKKFVVSRFDHSKFLADVGEDGEKASFDLIRAAVILVVAAALISIGTILKLPLSTTYVTFIVAMAAALPDNAWGRESAVYRVSGVITVIGGWFFTAFSAMVVAGIIATIIYFTEIYGVIGFLFFVAYVIYRTNILHKNKELEHSQKELVTKIGSATDTHIFDSIVQKSIVSLTDIKVTLSNSIKSLSNEDVYSSKSSYKKAKTIEFDLNKINADLLQILEFDAKDEFEYASLFAITLSAFRDLGVSTRHVSEQIYQYNNNNHTPFDIEQINDLNSSIDHFYLLLDHTIKILKNKEYDQLNDFKDKKSEFLKSLKKVNKNQIKRIKSKNSKTRKSILFFNIITELRNIAFISEDLIEALNGLYSTNDFIKEHK